VVEVSVERTDDERAAGSGLPATTLAYRGVSTYLAKGVRHPDESGRQDTPVTSGPDQRRACARTLDTAAPTTTSTKETAP